jgi:hypothetical protein
MVKIRWNGQDKSGDTWREASGLTVLFIEIYAKKKHIQVSDVLGVEKYF